MYITNPPFHFSTHCFSSFLSEFLCFLKLDCAMEETNKENVSPIATKKGNQIPVPVPAIAPCFKKSFSRRRMKKRIPLSDITNLLALQHHNVSVSLQSNSQSRNDSSRRPGSVTLRTGFR